MQPGLEVLGWQPELPTQRVVVDVDLEAALASSVRSTVRQPSRWRYSAKTDATSGVQERSRPNISQNGLVFPTCGTGFDRHALGDHVLIPLVEKAEII
ncbi:MAG TPA: hypothetical protein VGD71_15030 [Kribbella sp.]|jgi:hypothetical protein